MTEVVHDKLEQSFTTFFGILLLVLPIGLVMQKFGRFTLGSSNWCWFVTVFLGLHFKIVPLLRTEKAFFGWMFRNTHNVDGYYQLWEAVWYSPTQIWYFTRNLLLTLKLLAQCTGMTEEISSRCKKRGQRGRIKVDFLLVKCSTVAKWEHVAMYGANSMTWDLSGEQTWSCINDIHRSKDICSPNTPTASRNIKRTGSDKRKTRSAINWSRSPNLTEDS